MGVSPPCERCGTHGGLTPTARRRTAYILPVPARVLSADDPGQLAEAAAVLRAGGLVAFGTETVYGLGANALGPAAVAGVFAAKGRPRFDPLIVHLADAAELPTVAAGVPAAARRLTGRFWPGPLTVVLPKTGAVPDLVTAGLPGVAVRVPASAAARRFLAACGVPVCAPSANPFGGVSPTTAAHVLDGLGDAIDAVLDCGPCAVGVESTVVGFEGGRPVVLRVGGVPAGEIEAVLGEPVEVRTGSADPGRPLTSPGSLSRHYAPRTPLTLVSDPAAVGDPGRAGLLTFAPHPAADLFAAREALSETGDDREAAANLYAVLRRLDAAGLDRLYAAPVPDAGLGAAINDRLRRAAVG